MVSSGTQTIISFCDPQFMVFILKCVTSSFHQWSCISQFLKIGYSSLLLMVKTLSQKTPCKLFLTYLICYSPSGHRGCCPVNVHQRDIKGDLPFDFRQIVFHPLDWARCCLYKIRILLIKEKSWQLSVSVTNYALIYINYWKIQKLNLVSF